MYIITKPDKRTKSKALYLYNSRLMTWTADKNAAETFTTLAEAEYVLVKGKELPSKMRLPFIKATVAALMLAIIFASCRTYAIPYATEAQVQIKNRKVIIKETGTPRRLQDTIISAIIINFKREKL